MHVIVLIILIYFKLKWLEVPFRGILGQNYSGANSLFDKKGLFVHSSSINLLL